jgi:hypothetical protein
MLPHNQRLDLPGVRKVSARTLAASVAPEKE